MSRNIFNLKSLRTRASLFVLAVFLAGIWALSLYISQVLREDMTRLLGEQQVATVSLLGARLENDLSERRSALAGAAAGLSPALLGHPAALQAALEDRPVLQFLFNSGVVAVGPDGTAIACVPLSMGRVGINYMDRDYVLGALRDGQVKIGKPVIGKASMAPSFAIAVPIRNAAGKVIGALMGVTDLAKPSFLTEITDARYGKTGGYIIIDRLHRLIVIASDKTRTMEALPPPGAIPAVDRRLQGAEGWEIFVNPRGVEQLTAAKGIAAADWYLGVTLPVEEAFAPIRALQRRILVFTALLTLLLGALIWWLSARILRRQLAPLLLATRAADQLSQERAAAPALPVTSQDEIGELIGGFNRLLKALTQREGELEESEFRWKFAIEGSGHGLWDWNLVDNTVFFSGQWKQMLGYREDEIGDRLDEWEKRIHPDDKPATMGAVRDYIEGRSASYVSEHRVQCKDGTYKWILDRGLVVTRGADGKPQRMIGTHSDISERKNSEDILRIAGTAFESQQGMFITDANKVILRVNKAFTQITGLAPEEAVGQTPRLFASGRHDAAFYAQMWDSIGRSGGWRGEIWNRRKNGTVYPQLLSISSVRNEAGLLTHYIGAFSDNTSYRAAEEQIENLAFSDLLTGLPNRRMLIVRLQQALADSKPEGRQWALLFIDLDNFKTLNDALGHEQGDRLLKDAAERIVACLRNGDLLARLGSDEFVVLMGRLSEETAQAIVQAQATSGKIIAALGQAYRLEGAEHHCTASIGVTLFGQKPEEPHEPMRRAELAMYQAKAAGRNTLRFFDPQMQAAVNARVALEAALREAIPQRQFLLHYQAQVTDQGRITGVEVLLRWQAPRRGLISPAEFIPLAEENGLILPIGNWVLESACRQLALWADQPALGQLSVAVNVSARQFRESNFVDQVLAALARSGANPQRLKLELTESFFVADVDDVIAKMNVLKARGVGFAIDDFGTGYSSLAYLKRLPLERLKIDQGFVRDILIDPDDAAIARMIIALAGSMGLGVIAEGVETVAQRDFLSSLGCHTYQGYLFSRPVAVREFEALVRQTVPDCE